MNITRKLLISVDVEEFDIPEEYGVQVSLEDKLKVSHKGLLTMLDLFDKYNVRATFFVTAYWAQHYPELVRQLAVQHEVASHAHFHSHFECSHLESSKTVLQKITGKYVCGFRMPRLQKVDYTALKAAGYVYDASVNPTWLPGRYNNWDKARTMFIEKGCYIIPTSVSPLIRYPVFWLSVKNMPDFVTRYFSNVILNRDQVLSCYFHPWELCDLEKYSLPGYISRISGLKMQARLESFLQFLQYKGEFCTHIEWLNDQLPKDY
jgi:hypothetical protein